MEAVGQDAMWLEGGQELEGVMKSSPTWVGLVLAQLQDGDLCFPIQPVVLLHVPGGTEVFPGALPGHGPQSRPLGEGDAQGRQEPWNCWQETKASTEEL